MWFAQLGDSANVSVTVYQLGTICQAENEAEAAEEAYWQSLAIDVRLGDVIGQGSTLNQLGALYGQVLNRPEEAAAFYRKALGKAVETGDVAKEGSRRFNLAMTLLELHRLDEARQEIRRAIECNKPFGHASQPWLAWAALADIETDDGNIADAVAARREAFQSYLAYRIDGGEHHVGSGRLGFVVTQHLLGGDAGKAASQLTQYAAEPTLAHLRPFIHALEAIVAGSRDRSLADAPDLNYMQAAEILILIETLEKPR